MSKEKTSMPQTDRALSAVLCVVALIMGVFLLRLVGCGRSDEPMSADKPTANPDSRYVVTAQDVGGLRGYGITDTTTGARYVAHFQGHTASIKPVQGDAVHGSLGGRASVTYAKTSCSSRDANVQAGRLAG